MQQIINFIIRNKIFLLFVLLFFISLIFTIQSHSYHKSKFINSANFFTGGIYNTFNNTSQYFNLKSQNQLLSEENNHLKTILYNLEVEKQFPKSSDSTILKETYKLNTANVIRNSYAAKDNILLLNKGENDSIKQDLGVITTKGIVGIIDNTNANYATVISILNTTSKISAQLKKSNHFGTLMWNGDSAKFIQLIDIPKIANIKQGDTIVTSGRSSIFPKNIPIGTVENSKLDNAENYYEVNVKLFNDMTNIEHVYIIKNNDFTEIKNLLNGDNE